VFDWRQPGDRPATIRDDDLPPLPHLVEQISQILSRFSHTGGSHPVIVSQVALLSHIVGPRGRERKPTVRHREIEERFNRGAARTRLEARRSASREGLHGGRRGRVTKVC